MKPLARYHLIWALVILVLTCAVLGYTVATWWKLHRPPITTFWGQQLIIVAGAYMFWSRIKAFNAARKA